MSGTPISSIRNPVNRFDLIAYPILLILFSTLGLVAVSLGNSKGYFGIILGLICFMPFLIMGVVRKPKFIMVLVDGISLEFRFGKPIFVPFDEILWATPPKQSEWGEGALGIKGRFRYPIEYAACKAIRDAYEMKTGRQLGGDPSYERK
jgi:hypothetical protein